MPIKETFWLFLENFSYFFLFCLDFSGATIPFLSLRAAAVTISNSCLPQCLKKTFAITLAFFSKQCYNNSV